ncbi:hypothetical protein Hanom_Chr08g00750731 [Helianthus anomalus]
MCFFLYHHRHKSKKPPFNRPPAPRTTIQSTTGTTGTARALPTRVGTTGAALQINRPPPSPTPSPSFTAAAAHTTTISNTNTTTAKHSRCKIQNNTLSTSTT